MLRTSNADVGVVLAPVVLYNPSQPVAAVVVFELPV